MINKKINILLICILLLGILLSSCVDKSAAVELCADKGFQYTGKVFGSDIECINTTTGQLYRYDGKWDIIIKRG